MLTSFRVENVAGTRAFRRRRSLLGVQAPQVIENNCFSTTNKLNTETRVTEVARNEHSHSIMVTLGEKVDYTECMELVVPIVGNSEGRVPVKLSRDKDCSGGCKLFFWGIFGRSHLTDYMVATRSR